MLADSLAMNPATTGPGCHCDRLLIQGNIMLDLLLLLDVQNNSKNTKDTVKALNVNSVLVVFLFSFFLLVLLCVFSV